MFSLGEALLVIGSFIFWGYICLQLIHELRNPDDEE